MTDPFFFGYGSLVNSGTHAYPEFHHATLPGWRRAWRRAHGRPAAFLTVVRDRSTSIDGVIASVPGADWQALDEREGAYARIPAPEVRHPLPGPLDLAVYAIAERAHEDPTERNPILLSYLDTVVQGFLTHWGRNGVDRFFASTDGWSAPILNDRDAPIYSRVQRTTEAERDLVDALLESVNARPFQSATPENTWSDA